MIACSYVIILILQAVAVNSQDPAILSVTNVIPGATATFECSLPSLTSPTSLDIYKDNVASYQCPNIVFQCSEANTNSDYSDVTFTGLGTASAKGTFTVANADQTRDGGEWKCQYGSSSISSPDTFVVRSQSPATVSVENVLQGVTATFECSYPNLESPTTLDIYKDDVALYTCTDIALTCSKTSSDNDYSDVTFTYLDKALAMGKFTVANADQTRDGGGWTCKYGTSLISPSVIFVVSAQSPATLIVKNVLQGATATFKCSYPSLTSPTTLDIYKDSVAVYQCADIASTCSKSSTDNDYSDVTFTELGTASAKAAFTVANADQKRDGGEWTCKYGTSFISSSVTFVVRVATITQPGTSPAISPTPSSSAASSSTATLSSIQESETTTTNPTTTSEMNTSDETNTEWELMYFFSIVPTVITLTVVIIVITFVCNRTRKIKRSIPPSGMENYSVSRRGTQMNPAFEPAASYSMSMEHSNPFYVSRAHMLNENTGSSVTNMTHDQIFFEDTCSTKALLEGIEGIHFSARYMRNWSDLND